MQTNPNTDTHPAPVASPVKSGVQVKADFLRHGITITDWATKNGYKPNEVYLIIGGRVKAQRGKSHEIAVKLGMKAQPTEQAPI